MRRIGIATPSTILITEFAGLIADIERSKHLPHTGNWLRVGKDAADYDGLPANLS